MIYMLDETLPFCKNGIHSVFKTYQYFQKYYSEWLTKEIIHNWNQYFFLFRI